MKQKQGRRGLIHKLAAGALAVAIAVTATLAYSNLTQTARNDFAGIFNNGVRLHDDYVEKLNRKENDKQIYVENYGNSSVLVRVQLSEFLRFGTPEGTPQYVIGTAAGEEDQANHLDSWVPFKGGEPGAGNWTWVMGGSKYYLPTDNHDDYIDGNIGGGQAVQPNYQDADKIHERTFYDTGKDGGAGDVTFEEFIESFAQPPTEGKEVNQFTAAFVDRIKVSDDPEAKTVEETLGKGVSLPAKGYFTIAEWSVLPAGEKTGEYWVLDTATGWFYWASLLPPGKATGMLLNHVTRKDLEDAYFYGINAKMQAVTVSDIKEFTDNGAANGGAAEGDTLKMLSAAARLFDFGLTATRVDIGKEIQVDGQSFIVLDVNTKTNQALVVRKLAMPTAGPTNVNYASSAILTNLGAYATGTAQYGSGAPTNLKDYISAAGKINFFKDETATAASATARAFLLSEFDVFGTPAKSDEATTTLTATVWRSLDDGSIVDPDTFMGDKTSSVEDTGWLAGAPYFGSAKLTPTLQTTNGTTNANWWTRTSNGTQVTIVKTNGTRDAALQGAATTYIRPAMIIDIKVK